MSNFRQVDRETGFLLPPSVDEWLPERHLARFVVEVIEQLDLSALVGAWRGSGSASYHPSVLPGLLVYGYATGVFSSRKLERASYGSVALLKAEVEALMALAEAADVADVPDGMSVPEGLARRAVRLQRIAEAKAVIEARAEERHEREQAAYRAKIRAHEEKAKRTGRKPGGRPPRPPSAGPGPRDQVNLTDEGSRIMPVAGGGFEQACNAQGPGDGGGRQPAGGHRDVVRSRPPTTSDRSNRRCATSNRARRPTGESAHDHQTTD